MDTSEYYGGLYPSPPEEIEKEKNLYDEDYYYEERKMEELENEKWKFKKIIKG